MYRPELLGVLNVSWDSTTKVSVATDEDSLRRRAEELVRLGADWIDIGARSTWEHAEILSEQQEMDRLLPCVELLKREGFRVSVDTWGEQTAVEALRGRADMLNFTGGRLGASVLQDVAARGAKLVITYMPFGDPYAMRAAPRLRPTVEATLESLRESATAAREAGVPPQDIVLDPNVGIMHHRLEGAERLVAQAEIILACGRFQSLGHPVLLHSSRQQDENSRTLIGAYVVGRRPEYIRTHYPELIRELVRFANHQGSTDHRSGPASDS